MKRGTCEFCGLKNVEIDLEHVCPTWMGNTALAGLNSPQLRISRGDNKTIHQTSRPGGISAINITARCACKLKCNNGWMGILETKLSEFMKPMIADGATTTLNDERQILLATWAIKTAMVHEFVDMDRNVYFRGDERRHVKSWSCPPDDVWIWLGHNLSSAFLHTWPVYLNRGESLDRRPSLYAFTFAAGHFLMQVFAYRRSEWQGLQGPSLNVGPFGDAFSPLWPRRTSAVALWPPPVGITDDTLSTFQNRFHGGKVVREGVYRRDHEGGYRLESPRDPKDRNGTT